MTQEIIFDKHHQFAVITLNREKALNSLTTSMILAMQKKLELWEKDDAVKAVIIKAQNDSRAFCAGGDIRWVYNAGRANDPALLDFFENEYYLNNYINQFKKPYIALMNGITMGGGVGISLHGSFPVATDKFSFAMPETGIGFFPDIGASYILSRLKNNFGIYLGLTGKRIDAELSLKLGLVKYVISSENLSKIYDELLTLENFNNPYKDLDVFFQSKSINYSSENITDGHLINEAFSFNTLDEIINFLQQSDNEFYQDILQQLKAKSPLSLYITFEQLKRAKHLNLSECLKMDWDLVQHFMRDFDFYEGVRAVIIDKDNKPNWQLSDLSKVRQKVESYFVKM